MTPHVTPQTIATNKTLVTKPAEKPIFLTFLQHLIKKQDLYDSRSKNPDHKTQNHNPPESLILEKQKKSNESIRPNSETQSFNNEQSLQSLKRWEAIKNATLAKNQENPTWQLWKNGF